MRIGILSDTHGYLDEAVFRYFENCDEIWHAGDIGSGDVLDRLTEFRPVRAVYGNVDGPDIRSRVPEDLEWRTEDVRIFMTHIGGYPGRYEPRVKHMLAGSKPDLFLCGHSHVAKVMRDSRLGLIHINPGAAGNAGWHTKRTAIRLVAEAGKIRDVELIDLGPRGRRT